MKYLKDLILHNEEIPIKKSGLEFNRDFLAKPDINPYLVYKVLKELFGNPNANDQIDEDKMQWQWNFKYKNFFIEIYDWRLTSISIGIYHRDSDQIKSKSIAENLSQILSKQIQQKKAFLKTIAKTSKHKILENPFVTYYSTADNLLSIASQLDTVIIAAHDRNLEIELWDKREDLFRSAFLMLLSSFEGFLNILYELYLKVDLRNDRLYDRISREQIDIKLRIAPIYCDGFKTKTINHEDERFKRYLKLVNLRNDFVHANLNKSLERYVVMEDNHTFIIENEDNSEIPTNINRLQHSHIELAKEIIDDVIELVLESMETKTKREFERIIYDAEIEVLDDDGILIPA